MGAVRLQLCGPQQPEDVGHHCAVARRDRPDEVVEPFSEGSAPFQRDVAQGRQGVQRACRMHKRVVVGHDYNRGVLVNGGVQLAQDKVEVAGERGERRADRSHTRRRETS